MGGMKDISEKEINKILSEKLDTPADVEPSSSSKIDIMGDTGLGSSYRQEDEEILTDISEALDTKVLEDTEKEVVLSILSYEVEPDEILPDIVTVLADVEAPDKILTNTDISEKEITEIPDDAKIHMPM